MFDLKPDAPTGIRSEFKPIASNVPGIMLCEHLPKMAQWMHKAVVVRSAYHKGICHSNLPMYTGFDDVRDEMPRSTDPPSMGSVLRIFRAGDPATEARRVAELRLSALPAGLGRGDAQGGTARRLSRSALRAALHGMHGLCGSPLSSWQIR